MAGLTVNFDVLNQLNTPTLYADTLAQRPAPAIVGRIFFRTDAPYGIYRDTGTSWDLISSVDTTGITGSLTTGQIPYATGSTTIAGTNNLFWDASTNHLGIGTTTPGTRLDIHGTGNTLLQLNGTGTTNSFLVFQNAGTGEWRIGNNYSGGTNYFTIHDNSNNADILQINAGTTALNGIITHNAASFNNYTLTGIAAATSINHNRFISNYTFNAGITRTTIAEIGTQVSSNMTFSGTFTKSNDGVHSGFNASLNFTLNGNFTQNQPATYLQTPTSIQSGATFTGAFSVSHFSNTRLAPWISATPSTITNAYQLVINNLSGFSGASLSPTFTNRWGIYQDGASDNNYLAGKLLLNTTTVPTQILSVNGSSLFSGDITIGNAFNIITNTTTGTKFGTANTQKLSFWNATPIVQPTTSTVAGAFVVNAGTAVNTGSTFDGYTIGKVVTALRNAGLLA